MCESRVLLYQKILSEGYLLYDDRRLGEVCRVRLKVPDTLT